MTEMLAPVLFLILQLFGQPPSSSPSQDPSELYLHLIQHPVESYRQNVRLIHENQEPAWAMVRDHWSETTNASARQSLMVAFRSAGSPHLLDVVDLAMADKIASVRKLADDILSGFSFRFFFEDDDRSNYLTWRKSTDNLTQEQIIEREEKAFFTRLDSVESPVVRNEMLNQLLRIDFASNIAQAELRRRVASDCNVLGSLRRMLRMPFGATVTEVYAVALFAPDEQYLHDVILPLAELPYSTAIRYAAISLLSHMRSSLFEHEMRSVLSHLEVDGNTWILGLLLPTCTDTRIIPDLIGALNADAADTDVEVMIVAAIRKLAHYPDPEPRDAGFWRIWWYQNRVRFPEAHDLDIPSIVSELRSSSAPTRIYRRRMVYRELSGTSKPTYWFICPGYTAEPQEPPDHKFGLIIVLTPLALSNETASYWYDAVHSALKDSYYVAVVSGAVANVTSNVLAVVTDIRGHRSIDPGRIYIQGTGEMGMPAAALYLKQEPLFSGCYLLASRFQSSSLPDLVSAKGRKFYLQGSPDDKKAPMWQLNAGAELLRRHGARVAVAEIPSDHDYAFKGDPWKPVAAALLWLEGPRP